MRCYQRESQDSLLKLMKIDKFFSDKIVLPWQQHLARYLENRSTYLNKIFIDLHHLSKATCCQRINKIQNFRSFHVIMDQCLQSTSLNFFGQKHYVLYPFLRWKDGNSRFEIFVYALATYKAYK